MKKILAYLALTSVLLVAAAGGGLYATYQRLVEFAGQKGPNTGDVEIVIKRGMGPKAISALLAEKGVVSDSGDFYNYLRFVAKKAGALKAGEYMLSAGMTPDAIIAELQTGKVRELKFTVPEGARKEEIAAIIAKAGLSTEAKLRAAMEDPALKKAFGVPDTGAGGQTAKSRGQKVGVPGGIEGYLFPNTYQFPKNTSAKAILTKMNKALKAAITPEMEKRRKELGWPLHKVLTLAAIVEKETGQAHERPQISAVFHNRMRIGMKMQTDPTVIYGIKDYAGNIRKKDLLTFHPYNTYTIKGLPPGPIAAPGLAAIKAALWPAKTQALYFVSKNDGTHIFSKTLAEHEHNVDIWQRQYFRKKKR